MKRRPSRAVACEGKAAMSAGVAKRMARVIRERGDRVVPYLCIHCKKWHVGNTVGPKSTRGRPRPAPEKDFDDA